MALRFFYLLFGAMSTNVIKNSLYVSFIFANLFCSRALPYMWFPLISFPESFADSAKTLHFVILHFESLFLSIPLAISSLYKKTRWKRCEWESNHCESLGVASKVSVAGVIMVAPKSRGLNAQTTSSFKSLLTNMSQYLSAVPPPQPLETSQGGGREE